MGGVEWNLVGKRLEFIGSRYRVCGAQNSPPDGVTDQKGELCL